MSRALSNSEPVEVWRREIESVDDEVPVELFSRATAVAGLLSCGILGLHFSYRADLEVPVRALDPRQLAYFVNSI